MLTFIGIMQDFTTIYLTTAGGPMDSTYVPALELYYSAAKFSDYGYASAMGVVLFAAMLVGTIIPNADAFFRRIRGIGGETA